MEKKIKKLLTLTNEEVFFSLLIIFGVILTTLFGYLMNN